MEHYALFGLGLILLAVGAPLLVFGAARLDTAIGTKPFAVGIVAVAFGPCVAALAFDLAAVLRQPPIARLAVGHVVGHHIATLGLVLGIAALVRPIEATAKLFRTAIPLLFGATALFWLLARNNPLARVEAGILLTGFVVAMVLLIRAAWNETAEVKTEFANWMPTRTPLWMAGVFALVGLAALVAGANFIAAHIVGTAAPLKTPSLVVASTAGAFVTSLPTLVVAVVATWRRQFNLALGVVIVSALVNLLLVAGASAMVQPLTIDGWVNRLVIPAMFIFALLLVPPLFGNLRVPRWEGAVLLAAYVGFIVWQVIVTRRLP